LRKFRDPCFSIFLIQRPETLQFILVDSAVLPFAIFQIALDSVRKRFHPLSLTIPVAANSGFPLSFSLQKLASHLPHQVFAMAFYCRLENAGRVAVPPSLVLITDNLYNGFESRDFLFREHRPPLNIFRKNA
jgi:hypothetical protein